MRKEKSRKVCRGAWYAPSLGVSECYGVIVVVRRVKLRGVQGNVVVRERGVEWKGSKKTYLFFNFLWLSPTTH